MQRQNTIKFIARVILCTFFTFNLIGCTYGIQKQVIGTPFAAIDSSECSVVISKYTYPHAHFNDDQYTLIQTIRLFDNNSINCSEEEARAILKNEACAVGGNWVSISKERYPDLLSSCYQCEASIYKVELDSTITTNEYVIPSNPLQDDIELATIKSQRGQVWGYILGFALGFTLTLLLLQ